MLSEIKQLLELQSIDAGLGDLAAHEKQLRGQRAHIERKIASAEQDLEVLREQFRQLEHDSRMQNLAVDNLDQQIRDYQTRLDTGIISFKEMEDLRAKIISERKRMGELEDQALEAMDTIETSRADLANAEETHKSRVAAFEEQLSQLDTEAGATEQRRAELEAKRAATAAAVQPYLLSQYDNLHKEYQDPIVAVQGGTCGGCKLRVSGNTADRARGAMGIITCEHCSRILYSS